MVRAAVAMTPTPARRPGEQQHALARRSTRGRIIRRRVVVFGLGVSSTACLERRDPPGATDGAAPRSVEVRVSNPDQQEATLGADAGSGTVDDGLPFKPDGTKLLSTAFRTWIYTDTGPKRTRYGYLRFGAVVDAKGPPILNDGCAGGWYRVNPRGFVCVGKGATLDLSNPVATQANVRPVRGASLPYLYALSRDKSPFLYFRLPTLAQMQRAEGKEVMARALAWRERIRSTPLEALLGEPGPPPEFMNAAAPVEKPYGVEQRLRYEAHSGQANPDSGFAIKATFVHENRWFGLTTEHDVLPLDRVEVVVPSSFRGVALERDAPLDIGFVQSRFAPRYEPSPSGELVEHGVFEYRTGLTLTGRSRVGGLVEAQADAWVAASVLRRIEQRKGFPSVATGDRKWIDISIRDQSLVAYEGTRPVFATLVSTGRGELADPEKTEATVRGTFMVYFKTVSSTMDGDEDKSDSYALQDVPFVQYFHKGYALHGAYWHDEFGKVRSHGCVNLSPEDAGWLFEWTDPQVPEGWHAVLNKERGTVVYIHP
jgi:hypothetical protein